MPTNGLMTTCVEVETSCITVIKSKRDALDEVTEAKMRGEGWNKCSTCKITCMLDSGEVKDLAKYFTGRNEERLELGKVRIKAVLDTLEISGEKVSEVGT